MNGTIIVLFITYMFLLQPILELIHALCAFCYYFFAISRYIGEGVILLGTITYNSVIDLWEALIQSVEDFVTLLYEWYESINAVPQHPQSSTAEYYSYNIIDAIMFISLSLSTIFSSVCKRLLQTKIGRFVLDVANGVYRLLQAVFDMVEEIFCFVTALCVIFLVIRHCRSLYREIRLCLEKVKKYLRVILSWFHLQPEVRSEQETPMDLSDSSLCVICRDSKKNILLLPCRHLCMCSLCSSRTMMQPLGEICPLCRSEVQSYLAVYT